MNRAQRISEIFTRAHGIALEPKGTEFHWETTIGGDQFRFEAHTAQDDRGHQMVISFKRLAGGIMWTDEMDLVDTDHRMAVRVFSAAMNFMRHTAQHLGDVHKISFAAKVGEGKTHAHREEASRVFMYRRLAHLVAREFRGTVRENPPLWGYVQFDILL